MKYLRLGFFLTIDADFLAFFLLAFLLILRYCGRVIRSTKSGDETILLLLKYRKKKRLFPRYDFEV